MSSTKRPPVALGDELAPTISTSKVDLFDAQGHVTAAWLAALGDGGLTEVQRDAVMAHVVVCEACRKASGLEQTIRFDPNVSVGQRTGSSESLIGKQVGEYQVLERLDEGAMGVVYRGVQPVIGKPVAIKVMQREFARDPENSHRLVAEARAVNAIGHPNIVDVFSFGTLPDGRQYLVMELLTGKNLRLHGREQTVALPDALDILTQVAAALAAAHAAGVVHRDLKPSNLFISRHQGMLHVTVLDFGVAKGLQGTLSSVATTPGMMIGTAGFMAPEQILGTGVGPPADVYALGCVAWWLLARQEVFTSSSESDDELIRLHLEAAPPALKSRVAVPVALDTLVNAMLQKSPEARPTAAEAHRVLGRLLAESRSPAPATLARSPSDVPTLPPAAPPPRRSGEKERHSITVPVPPVFPAQTVLEVPVQRASRGAADAASEETVRPAPRRSRSAGWLAVALLAAAIAAFFAFKTGLLSR